MEDLFKFTEEDAESNFPELKDGGDYTMTISSIETKTAKSGKDMIIMSCLINASPKAGDVSKKFDMIFMVTPFGNKARYQFSASLFDSKDLMAGKIKRDDFIGVQFSFKAKKNGDFFNYRDVKRATNVPVIDGGLSGAIAEAQKPVTADDICF